MRFFNNETYQFQFLRTLGHAYHRAADVGECLETAARITEGDDASWYQAWRATADRVYAVAERCASAGHAVSAGEAYLRASNYYRTAEFFAHHDPDDPHMLETARLSRTSFQKATPPMALAIEAVEIPYAGTTLPGYVIGLRNRAGKAPAVLCHTGFDGTAEEVALCPGFAAAARGYTCIVFDGPGQGRAIREQKLPFRRDWEKVVGPVIDFAVARTDVDSQRVALVGISFGGNLAPRAAARERRLAALVANGGVYSFYEPIAARLPFDPLAIHSDELEATMQRAMADRTEVRFFVQHGNMCFGTRRVSDLIRAIKEYDVVDADRITCPTLVVDAEGEHLLPGQARRLFERLTCPKTFLQFTAAEGAAAHCQVAAEGVGTQRIFDWLDDVFAGKPVPAEA